jgi:hypothetical protein
MAQQRNLRWAPALAWGLASSLVSFVIFNVAFIFWAERTYPEHNSMAGVAAFFYGIPVGLLCGIAGFFLALAITNRKRKSSLQQ